MVMSRFVGAASVAGGDRHTITTWMPSAARLAFVKATQGRSKVALAPLGSEQGVVGAALGHRGFAKKEASVRRPCLYYGGGTGLVREEPTQRWGSLFSLNR